MMISAFCINANSLEITIVLPDATAPQGTTSDTIKHGPECRCQPCRDGTVETQALRAAFMAKLEPILQHDRGAA
jgi:hypothetical protein